MPGLHLIISDSRNDCDRALDRQVFSNSLDMMKHFEWYSTSLIYTDSAIAAAKSTYSSYPFSILQDERKLTLIDGAIYNKSPGEIKEELEALFSRSSLACMKEGIKGFVQSTHGEFIVANYDKRTKQLMIFNDALGRLPFYYSTPASENSLRFVASREMNFVVSFLKKRDFDRIAVAEYLLFGYVLGNKSILREVKRLAPCSLLIIDAGNKDLQLEQTFRWNLDSEDQTDADVRAMAVKLTHLFTASLKEVVSAFPKNYTHVVSLSGGLDSRATLGGFVAGGLYRVACSFASGEDRAVREIANRLRVKHHFISSPFEIRFEDYLRTFGFLNLGRRSRVSYLLGLRQKIGDKAVLYTGDGGDKTLAPLNSKSSNLEELLNHLLKSDHVHSLVEIASLLNISIEEFRNHLKKHLAEYPERTMDGKLAHFRIFERGFNSMFIGEERSRFFMWSTTPFYWVPFFEIAMSVPQKHKASYILYKYFLSTLNSQLPEVAYYDRMIPLALPDSILRIYFSLFDWLKYHFYQAGELTPLDIVRGRNNRSEDEEARVLKKFAGDCLERKALEFLEMSKIHELVERETNPEKLFNIVTLIAYSTFLTTL